MIFRFGSYTIDTRRRELTCGSAAVNVEPQVFDLLVYLIENRDRVVGKNELFDAVWQGRIVSEATLSSRINAARRAIGDTGEKQALIRTIPRRGFLFAGESIRPEPGPAPAEEAESAGGQTITFCRTPDGVRLAVASAGQGPVLVKTANWLSHLEYDWESPLWRRLYRRLARTRQLVRYDARGTGLSDWEVQDISFDAFERDLETVIEAMGLKRFSLFGISQGVAVAIGYAARHPERVDKLVLHGGYAQGRRRRGAEDEEQANAFHTLIRQGWAKEHSPFMQAFSSIYVPKGTPEQINWFINLQRVSTTAANAVRIRAECDGIDIVDLLPRVRAPTLVTHSRHDHVAPFEQGRLIAASIPGARFVSLESDNHALLPEEPAWARWVGEMETFLSA